MPNRFQVNQHKLAHDFLVERDGELCFFCRKKPPWVELEIDHLDGNPSNWKPRNLHLLCGTDNLSLRHKTTEEKRTLFRIYGARNVCVCDSERARELKQSGTSVVKGLVDYMSGSPEMKTNSLYEIRFRNWVIQNIQDNSSISKQEAVNSGAEFTGCNTVTADRYLKKLTSAVGVLKEDKDSAGNVVITWRFPVDYKESPCRKKEVARPSVPAITADAPSGGGGQTIDGDKGNGSAGGTTPRRPASSRKSAQSAEGKSHEHD